MKLKQLKARWPFVSALLFAIVLYQGYVSHLEKRYLITELVYGEFEKETYYLNMIAYKEMFKASIKVMNEQAVEIEQLQYINPTCEIPRLYIDPNKQRKI